MGGDQPLQYWEVWYPKSGATGTLIGRGLLDPTEVLILHSAPDILNVEISDQNGQRLAYAENLDRTQETPMCRLERQGKTIKRMDIWPGEADLGTPVLLPGGEVGILKSWWNAPDRKEWRWLMEFYNSAR